VLPLLESAAALTSAKIDLLPHQVVLTHRIALRRQHFHLPQLRNNLFRLVSLLGHFASSIRLKAILQGGPLSKGQATLTADSRQPLRILNSSDRPLRASLTIATASNAAATASAE
jgi:hypothetical protein